MAFLAVYLLAVGRAGGAAGHDLAQSRRPAQMAGRAYAGPRPGPGGAGGLEGAGAGGGHQKLSFGIAAPGFPVDPGRPASPDLVRGRRAAICSSRAKPRMSRARSNFSASSKATPIFPAIPWSWATRARCRTTWRNFKSKEPMQVTKNEKALLSVLVAIVFVAGNFFGYRWLAQKQSSLQLAHTQLRADQAEAEMIFSSPTWAQLKAWVHDHEPALGDEGAAKAQVLEYVLKGARDNKLEIMEQSLNDAQHGAGGTRINVSVKVKGSMEGLVKWLTALQQPDQFYAISSFSLKADEDQKSMVCTLQIARYFKEGS